MKLSNITVIGLLGDMADVCSELSRRSSLVSAEASVAVAEADLQLAQSLLQRAKGINEAVDEMMVLIRKVTAP